jgi:hypothetical protein
VTDVAEILRGQRRGGWGRPTGAPSELRAISTSANIMASSAGRGRRCQQNGILLGAAGNASAEVQADVVSQPESKQSYGKTSQRQGDLANITDYLGQGSKSSFKQASQPGHLGNLLPYSGNLGHLGSLRKTSPF